MSKIYAISMSLRSGGFNTYNKHKFQGQVVFHYTIRHLTEGLQHIPGLYNKHGIDHPCRSCGTRLLYTSHYTTWWCTGG